jgi:hypothetical protein
MAHAAAAATIHHPDRFMAACPWSSIARLQFADLLAGFALADGEGSLRLAGGMFARAALALVFVTEQATPTFADVALGLQLATDAISIHFSS